MKTNRTSRSSRVPNNLPPRPHPFVNREEEIRQAISALLQDKASVVALIGMAGIGKTSLALEITYRLLDKGQFAGGMIWLPVRDLPSFDDLTGKVGTILGISDSEVYSRLDSQRCLVILDGLDELNPHYAPEVERFLETLPAPSKALVTSRKESALPPQTTVIQLGPFSEQAAIEFFSSLAIHHGIQTSEEDCEKIAGIVRTLDYHPLALAIAASMAQRRSFDELLFGLQESIANLSEREGQIEDALKYWSQMLETLKQTGTYSDTLRAKVDYNLGRLLAQQGRWYDGLSLLEESLAIRRLGNDLNAHAATIYQIARVHHLIGNLDTARIHYRDALRLYEHTGNAQGVAACKTGLGRLMIQTGFVDDALRELEPAKQIYRQLGDDRRIAEVDEVLQVANHIKERQPA
ncbi:MAG: tetratricopeptide repeat protein [Chloroflexota bacterium]